MSETISLFLDALVTCLRAAPLTLTLTALSVAIGLCMAIPLSVIHQRQHTLAARLVNAFTYFGGVPRILVPDSCKTSVQKADYYDPV